jgi:hypothetical protein
MSDQEKIDKLLDRALGEYSATSPRAGLEGRVLARLEAEAARPRRVQWWLIVAPVIAVLIVVALLVAWRPRPQKAEVVSVPPVTVEVNRPRLVEVPRRSIVQPPSKPVRSKQPVKASPKTPDSEPRLATFPSRDSDDELVKLAMRFVQAHPAEAKEIVQEQTEFREMAEAFTAPLKEEK